MFFLSFVNHEQHFHIHVIHVIVINESLGESQLNHWKQLENYWWFLLPPLSNHLSSLAKTTKQVCMIFTAVDSLHIIDSARVFCLLGGPASVSVLPGLEWTVIWCLLKILDFFSETKAIRPQQPSLNSGGEPKAVLRMLAKQVNTYSHLDVHLSNLNDRRERPENFQVSFSFRSLSWELQPKLRLR